jgi:hypothetical protein
LCPPPDAELDVREVYIQPCNLHVNPDRAGADDGLVGEAFYLSGSAESGGATGRAFAEVIHRRWPGAPLYFADAT